MVLLTRLNSKELAVNSDLIKFIENAPDTVITLVNGEKVIVRESVPEVVRRVVEYRRMVLSGLPLPSLTSAAFAPSIPPACSACDNESSEEDDRG